MKTIVNLTPEQEALLPVYRDKWLEIGLSTEEIDEDRSRKAIENLYKITGYEAPKDIHYVDGLNSITQDEFPISSLWVGSLSAYWLAFYDFFFEQFDIGEEVRPMLEAVIEVAKAGGSIHFEKDRVIVIQRPEVIKMRDGHLHCEDGPSIRFRDGFEVYSWNGTRVPRKFIMEKDTLDPTLAITHENVEQRRALAEIIGWDRVIEMLKPTIIDEDDPEIGTLLEVDIPEIGKERFIRVLCGTNRQFALPVPPDTDSALGAQAFLHGVSLNDFLLPEIRT